MYGSEKAEPREDAVVKQLFTPSPERRRRRERADKGSPTNRRKGAGGRRRTNGGFRLGVIGVCFFLLMCGLAVWVTVKLNRGWMDVTMEDVTLFFSNKPIRSEGHSALSVIFPPGKLLFGYLGALPLATSIGILSGIFTFLFMFYDSDVPGNFPPTPVSPRRQQEVVQPSAPSWHLGYIFVPVNTLAAFSLALFYLRLHMALPLL